MKFNVKLFIIHCLIAGLIISIGLIISRTFLCGMICGILYYFITDLVELYFKEREEK